MKIRLTKYILGILAITFVMTSCSKNNDELASVASNKQDILTFKTIEEFNTTVQKVNSMKSDERVAWEKSQGFKSFGTICDEFYATLNPMNLDTQSKVDEFVSRNSDKIQIYVNNTGDKYCEAQEFDNSARYLMNSNRMYIIGSNVIRKFNEGIVSTDINNLDQLKAAKSFSDVQAINKIESQKLIKQKSTAATNVYIQNNEVYAQDSNNKYRLVVRLNADCYYDESSMNTFDHMRIQVSNYYFGFLGILYGKAYDTNYNISLYCIDLAGIYGAQTVSTNNYESIKERTYDWSAFAAGGNVNTQNHITHHIIYATNTVGCTINSNVVY